MMRALRVTWAVAWRDLQVEARARELLPALVQFMVLALVIANFAFDLNRDRGRLVGPGILWMVLVFVGLTAFSRAFAGERERSSLEAMLLSGSSPAAILVGKALASALILAVCELVLLPALAVFLGAPVNITSFATVLLSVAGMALLGAFFAAVAARTRANQLLLPVLAVPFWVPYVVVGSGAIQQSLQGVAPIQTLAALGYLDILFLVVATLAAGLVLDD
jgi:heme exporter protein B